VLTLVDVESLARTLRKIDRHPADAPSLLQAVAGPTGSGRTAHVVYGSGNRHSRLQRILADADYRVVDVAGQREQVRMRLALDALDAARSPDPPGTLVLAADDLELGDLLRRLRGSGPRVIVIGRRHPAMVEASDRLVDADELETLLPRARPQAHAEARGAWDAATDEEADFEESAAPGAFRIAGERGQDEDDAPDRPSGSDDDEVDDFGDELDEDVDEDLAEDEDLDEEGDDDDDDLQEPADELYEGLDFEDEGATLPRRTAASNLDLELAIDEEDAAPLDFDDREDDAAEPEAGDRLSPRSAESSEERPLGRRRRRSRGGRRRNRGAGGGDSAGGGAPREAVARESHDRAPVRPRAEPVAAQRGGPSRSGDAMGLLREALGRVLQGSPRLVWGTVVLEAMQELDPSFHEGEPSFGSFEQLLEEAQRRGVLRLERSPATESYLVTAIASE
jgi:hypothetical protein